MPLLTAPVVLALLMAGQSRPAWDLAKCQRGLTDVAAKGGHACTTEHLNADLAQLARDPLFGGFTPQQLHDSAQHGDWEAAAEVRKGLAGLERSVEQRKVEQEKADAGLDKELKGTALLAHCETFQKMRAVESGLETPPHGGTSDWFNLGQHTGTCMGYVSGVFEELLLETAYDLTGAPRGSVICPADGVDHFQVVRIVTRFLGDHPERLHEFRLRLVKEALQKAFPCPKNPTSQR